MAQSGVMYCGAKLGTVKWEFTKKDKAQTKNDVAKDLW